MFILNFVPNNQKIGELLNWSILNFIFLIGSPFVILFYAISYTSKSVRKSNVLRIMAIFILIVWVMWLILFYMAAGSISGIQ